MSDRIVEFVRKKDFVFIRELGQGACGRTVLLHDQVIDEHFVCKKFSPIYESLKQELFINFVREIKLLHLLNHPNIVRVFNYYLYPDLITGYILMELVEGVDIEEYIKSKPGRMGQIFLQVIDGFAHLEKNGILHRDIRVQNILVSKDGVAKIIDFGFGKQASAENDFGKSITLNWWCEPPLEFADKKYNFSTEVYFVGKLFERLLHELGIEQFPYKGILSKMCARDPANRHGSFSIVKQEVLAGQFSEIPFSRDELFAYRKFADDLSNAISKIESGTKYFDDVADIERKLELAYRDVMLEERVPSNLPIIGCFLNGSYYYSKVELVLVDNLRAFLQLLRSGSKEKKSVILSNILSRLNTITRYSEKAAFEDDDIPF